MYLLGQFHFPDTITASLYQNWYKLTAEASALHSLILPPCGLQGLMILIEPADPETVRGSNSLKEQKEKKTTACFGRWHHQEVSALPDCGQDVNQWIERSFGDLVGH
jgi:hypothetical protein